MASVLKVDKLDPQSGTALEIGTSGDTISVPSGATLDISASTLTPPATMPASSGVNFTALNATNLGSGTVPDARFPATLPAADGANLTALNATNLGSGTVPTARLGTGTASGTTFLAGDQTYKAAGGGKLVQFVNTADDGSLQYSNSQTFVITTCIGAITPTSASNKIFVQVGFNNNFVTSPAAADIGGRFAVYRDIAAGGYSVNWTMNYSYNKYGITTSTDKNLGNVQYCGYLDSPATTDEVTYAVYWRCEWTGSWIYTKNGGQNDVTLMEIDFT